jgi:hypothetical protein
VIHMEKDELTLAFMMKYRELRSMLTVLDGMDLENSNSEDRIQWCHDLLRVNRELDEIKTFLRIHGVHSAERS